MLRRVRYESSRLRCAPFRGGLGADPVGTAGNYDAFVVVESPLPWARDATGCWPFDELGWTGPCHEAADGRRWRPVVVAARSPAGEFAPEAPMITVTTWERAGPGGSPYRPRRWWTTDAGVVPGIVGSVVDGAGPEGAASGGDDPGPAGPPVVPGADGTGNLVPPAVHVCTHGRRDVCCGARGTELFDAASLARGVLGPVWSGRPVELWRCSHTGGHRFAPTGITFPDGLVWAELTPGLLHELGERADRTADGREVRPPSAALVAACRGSSALPEGPAQVADRAAWARFGWGWVDGVRRVEVVGPVPTDPEDPPVMVRLDGWSASGVVHVGVAGHVPTPPCGTTDLPTADQPWPVEPEWEVVDSRWRSTSTGQ